METTQDFSQSSEHHNNSSENFSSSQIINLENVDIYQYPAEIIPIVQIEQKFTKLIKGDLHGNTIVLLNMLIRHGLLELKGGQKDYQELVEIYKKKTDELKKEDIEQFSSMLKNAKIVGELNELLMLGDVLADRGMNDSFTLLLYQRLQTKQSEDRNILKLNTLLSNHDLEFIVAYFTGFPTKQNKNKQNVFDDSRINNGQKQSLDNLIYLRAQGIINDELVEQLAENYLQTLNLFSYDINVDKDTIEIYSHAPVGLRTVRQIAEKFSIEYNDSTVSKLAETINKINVYFKENIKEISLETANVIAVYFNETNPKTDREVIFEINDKGGFGYYENIVISQINPIARLIWQRQPDKANESAKQLHLSQEEMQHEHSKGYKVKFVYGHDGAGVNLDFHCTSLDSDLGKEEGKNAAYTAKLSVNTTFEKIFNLRKEMESIKFASPTLAKEIERVEKALQTDLENPNHTIKHIKQTAKNVVELIVKFREFINIKEQLKKQIERIDNLLDKLDEIITVKSNATIYKGQKDKLNNIKRENVKLIEQQIYDLDIDNLDKTLTEQNKLLSKIESSIAQLNLRKDFEYQDWHPALPSIQNSAKRFQEGTLFSDHVYLQAEFELAQGQKIIAVTCNILGGPEDGAYRDTALNPAEPAYGSLLEDKDTLSRRHKLNTNFLRLVTDKKKPDFIVVQESSPDVISSFERQSTDKYYRQHKKNGSKRDTDILLLNTRRYSEVEHTQSQFHRIYKPTELDVIINNFKDENSSQEFLVWNIHASFAHTIAHKEMLVLKILEQRQREAVIAALDSLQNNPDIKNQIEEFKASLRFEQAPTQQERMDIVEKIKKNLPQKYQAQFKEAYELQRKKLAGVTLIFCGDWNADIGPIDTERRNIVTTLGHSKWHPEKVQSAKFPDGGFSAYIDPESGEYIIKQARTHPINPATGELYKEHELAPLNCDQMPENQSKEAKKFRMVMRLDNHYKTSTFVVNETLYDLERKLQQILNCDRALQIYPAKTVNNETGVVIKLTEMLWTEIKIHLIKMMGNKVVFDKFEERGESLIYTDKNNADLLLSELLEWKLKDFEIKMKNRSEGIDMEIDSFINNVPQHYAKKYLDKLLQILIKHTLSIEVKSSFFSLFSSSSTQQLKKEFIYNHQILRILNKLVDAEDISEKAILFKAVKNNHIGLLSYLIASNSNKGESTNIDITDEYEKTPLFCAVCQNAYDGNSLNIIKYLLGLGANPLHMRHLSDGKVLTPVSQVLETANHILLEFISDNSSDKRNLRAKFANNCEILSYLFSNSKNDSSDNEAWEYINELYNCFKTEINKSADPKLKDDLKKLLEQLEQTGIVKLIHENTQQTSSSLPSKRLN